VAAHTQIKSLLRAAKNSRTFVQSSIIRELQAKYLNSRLGALWLVLNPLIQVALYAFIFSFIMSAKIGRIDNNYSYTIYLLSGFCFWFNFIEIFTRATNIFGEFGPIMKKNSVPKISFPAIIIASSLIHASIFIGVVILLFLAFAHTVSFTALYVIPVTILVSVIALSLGVLTSILSLIFHDLRQIVPTILQFSFWTAPIVYTLDILPPKVQRIIEYNPLTFMVKMYHNILAYGTAPEFADLLLLAVFAGICLVLCGALYVRAKDELVDML